MLDNCRICLKSQTDLLNTASVVKNTTYNEDLFFCVPEVDWKCSISPSLICNNCIKDLQTATSFRRLCLKSDQIRTKYIQELNISSKQDHLDNKKELKPNIESVSKSEPEGSINKSVAENIAGGIAHKNEIEINENLKIDEYSVVVKSENIDIVRISTKSKVIKSLPGIQTNNSLCCPVNQEGKELNEISKDFKLFVPSRSDRSCIFCNCTFSKYTTLANHVRSIHTFEKCFKCEICGEGFTNSEILSRHKNRHTGERKYVCSYCGKKFFTNSDLNHHIQRHQNKRNYKCDLCENKSFNTANSLRTHKLVVHTNPNEWKYLCPICGRKCVTQASLTVHLKRHSNEKDFSCHLCIKKFCTKSELSKHISSHSNMRLHKCDVCNQEYKDRKVMERHLTKKHGIGNAKIVERVKKFVCNICPKKFIGKRQLEKHLRSHSGVRPFKCEVCEQAFICSSYIKGHMRNKHSMNI